MHSAPRHDPSPGWPGLLAMLGERHFSPFKTYVNRAHRTVVILNPKVGTKSFRQALIEGMREIQGIDDPSQGRYRLFRNARRFPFAPLADYAHALRFPGQYQFYCFVRNPYARLRSAWQNKFAYGHASGYSRSIRRRELPRLRRFAAARSLAGAAGDAAIPFTTFLAYVESQPSGRRDHHWDDQHRVLLMHRIHYQRCFRLEGEFATGMAQIFDRIGLTGTATQRILCTQMNASPREEAPVFTADLAARVHALYRRDFELFGYARDSWQGL
jgi:chondroitin 4-sulfotransferase 13